MGLFSRRSTPTIDAELVALREEVAQLRQFTETRTSLVTSPSQVRISRANAEGGQQRYEPSKLYEAYVACPWISAPIDTIARHIVSGGWTLEPEAKGSDLAQKKRLEDFFLYCNEEQDLVEIVTATIQDLFIVAEAFWELVGKGKNLTELYTVSPLTMSVIRDDKGTVTGYVQVMDDGTKVHFTPDQILRFVVRGPLGEPLSPLRKLLSSAAMYNFIQTWGTKFFQHGAKPNFQIKLPENSRRSEAEAYGEYWEEMYSGAENAYRAPVMYAGAEIVPITAAGGMEMDFLATLKYVREELLAVIGAIPSSLGISDNGSRLSDNGEEQSKLFRFNTVRPMTRLIEEKVNFGIVARMGVTGWTWKLRQEDYRSDADILTLILQQVQNGLLSRDSANALLGRDAKIPGGQITAISIPSVQNITPTSDLDSIHGSQFTAAQQTAINTGLNPHAEPEDLAQASPRDPMQPGDQHPVAVQDQRFDQKAQQPPGAQRDDKEEALADLARWQKVAKRALREGKVQPLFETDAIDPVTVWSLSLTLAECETPEAITTAFDAAFRAIRSETPIFV